MEPGYNRFRVLTIALLLACFTLGSLSVTGLLQSTERVSSSGIVVLPAPPAPIIPGGGGAPPPPPPEPAVEIDVYANQECTQALTTVTWGQIEAGGQATRTVYVRNNGDTSVVLSLNTDNWSPSNAQEHMTLTWNYSGNQVSSGQVVRLDLTLSVSGSCPALPSFDFDIVIVAS